MNNISPQKAEEGVLTLKTMKKIIVLACVFCLMFSFAGCGKLEISREIAKVNGRIATKAEFMYYLENVKQQMISESGATDLEGFWDAEIDGVKASDAAKNKALEEMLRVEMACIKAEEKGLSVPAEEAKSIRQTVKAADRDQKAQVDALLDATGLSQNQLIDLLMKTTLANLYVNDLNTADPELLVPSDEEVKAAYEQEYVHVKHVLISNTEEAPAEGEAAEEAKDPETVKAEKLKVAEEVLKKAKAGENFDNLVKEYGEDPGMEQSPDGYTFTKGTMVAPFETASYALAVGEISDLVETDFGWHIIKKLALPTSGEDYDQAVNSIKAKLSSDKSNAIIDGYKADMTIEIFQKVVDGIKVK